VLLLRDRIYPLRSAATSAYREALHAYAKQSPEADRRALNAIHGTENYLGAHRGDARARHGGARRSQARGGGHPAREGEGRDRRGRFRWTSEDPWQRIDRAVALHAARADEIEAIDYSYGTLLRRANDIVALAYEGRRPDGERLKDYREARAARLRRQVAGDSPWYKDLETVRPASFIERAGKVLGRTIHSSRGLQRASRRKRPRSDSSMARTSIRPSSGANCWTAARGGRRVERSACRGAS
jgi:hypothetical protein